MSSDFAVEAKRVLDTMPSNVLGDNAVVAEIVAEILLQNAEIAAQKAESFAEYEERLTDMIGIYVNNNSRVLNASIKSFSDVQQHLQEERRVLQGINSDNVTAIEAMESHSAEMHELYVQQMRSTAVLRVLEDVQGCTELERAMETAIGKGDYIHAATQLRKLEKNLDKPFGNARCMTALRQDFMGHHRKLFDIMTAKLSDCLYRTEGSDEVRVPQTRADIETCVKVLHSLRKNQDAQGVVFSQLTKRTETLLDRVTLDFVAERRHVAPAVKKGPTVSSERKLLSLTDGPWVTWDACKAQADDMVTYVHVFLSNVNKFLRNFRMYEQEVIRCEFPYYNALEGCVQLSESVRLDANILHSVGERLTLMCAAREGSGTMIILSKVVPMLSTALLGASQPMTYGELSKFITQTFAEFGTGTSLRTAGKKSTATTEGEFKDAQDTVTTSVKSIVITRLMEVIHMRQLSLDMAVPLSIALVYVEKVVILLCKPDKKQSLSSLPSDSTDLEKEFRTAMWTNQESLEVLMSTKGKNGLPRFLEELPAVGPFLIANPVSTVQDKTVLKTVVESLNNVFVMCVMNILTTYRPVMSFLDSLSSLGKEGAELDALTMHLRSLMVSIANEQFGPVLTNYANTRFAKLFDEAKVGMIDVRTVGNGSAQVLKTTIELVKIVDEILTYATDVPACNQLIYGVVATMLEQHNMFWLVKLNQPDVRQTFSGRVILEHVPELLRQHTNYTLERLRESAFGPLMTQDLCMLLNTPIAGGLNVIPRLSTLVAVMHVAHSFEWLAFRLVEIMRKEPFSTTTSASTTAFPCDALRDLELSETEPDLWCSHRCYDLWRNAISVARVAFLVVALDIRASLSELFRQRTIHLAELQQEIVRMHRMVSQHLGPRKAIFLFGTIPAMCLQHFLTRVHFDGESSRIHALTDLRRDISSLAHALTPVFPRDVQDEVLGGLHVAMQLTDAMARTESTTVHFPALGPAYAEVDFSCLAN